MNAHALETLLPIKHEGDHIANLRQGRVLGWHMDDVGFVLAINGCCDDDFRTIGGFHCTRIAGLSAARCIKHGPICHDTAALIDRGYGCGAFLEIGIVSKE